MCCAKVQNKGMSLLMQQSNTSCKLAKTSSHACFRLLNKCLAPAPLPTTHQPADTNDELRPAPLCGTTKIASSPAPTNATALPHSLILYRFGQTYKPQHPKATNTLIDMYSCQEPQTHSPNYQTCCNIARTAINQPLPIVHYTEFSLNIAPPADNVSARKYGERCA